MNNDISISTLGDKSGWQAFYDDRVSRRNAADTDALKAHFEAELAHARITMQAMGLSPVRDGSSHIDASQDQKGKEAVTQNFQNGVPETPPRGDEGVSESGLTLPAALEPFKTNIIDASEATNVPADLLAAVIWDESRGLFDASSKNPGNGQRDIGLMQVNPSTFAALQKSYPDLLPISDMSDPATNVMAGALYLAEQKQDFGDWETALRAYNSGPGNVNPNDLNDISRTGTGTANYVEKVMEYWGKIRQGEELPA